MAGEEQKPAEAAADTAAVTVPPEKFATNKDGSRTRTLIQALPSHDGTQITHIHLRKPRYRDIMDLGDPEAYVVVDGGYVPQTDMVLIERYIGRLAGIDVGLLELMDYRDALALRDAVRSFFK